MLCTSALFLGLALQAPGAPPPVDRRPAFLFGELDGDGLPDALVSSAEGPRLYRNDGAGGFQDVTEQAGLTGSAPIRQALWEDFDGDGRADLLLVPRAAGRARLLRATGRDTFEDVTRAAGLELDAVQSARSLDYDADGATDLLLAGAEAEHLYRNLGRGRFESVLSGGFGGASVNAPAAPPVGARPPAPNPTPDPAPAPAPAGAPRTKSPAPPSNGSGRAAASAPVGGTSAAPGGSATSAGSASATCAPGVEDFAMPGTCLAASSAPTLGMLLPLSVDWFVDGAGNTGLGTTSPSARLDVLGAVRTDTAFVNTSVSGPPLVVSSSDLVAGLNADLLDGVEAAAFSQLGQTIDGGEIEDFSVGNADLAPGCIDTSKIATNAIGLAQLADNSVSTTEVVNGTLRNEDVSAVAAIAGTKIDADFGAQNLTVLEDTGIGTAFPQYRLHVTDHANRAAFIENVSPSTFATGVYAAALSGTGVHGEGEVNGVFGEGNVYGVQGYTDSGTGVFGRATGTSGTNYGVFGESNSVNGFGLYARNTSNGGDAMRAVANGTGAGLRSEAPFYGVVAEATDFGIGVQGTSPGVGVLGSSDQGIGVQGNTADDTGWGVYGRASHTSGSNAGVYGLTLSSSGRGVYGRATSTSGAASAVLGEITTAGATGTAVRGIAPFYGVLGEATGNGVGVQGVSQGIGVYGSGTTNSGVLAHTDSTSLLHGALTAYADRVGVYGDASDTTGETRGVYGVTRSSAGFGGYFEAAESGGVALRANNVVNLGDILVAANGADAEFRVNSSGDVFCDASFIGGGADYAEWLEREDPSATFAPGEVVGVVGGRISLDTRGADQVLVISTNPVLVGNAAGAESDDREGHEKVAFLGQVPVRVRGAVAVGDLLVPSGLGDGVALARRPSEVTAAELGQVIGMAWSGAGTEGGLVNCAVGLAPTSLTAGLLEGLDRRLRRLEQERVRE